jgi:hypothetical protein
MSHNDRLRSLLARHSLTRCSDCQTTLAADNIGWNPAAEFGDVLPIVYVACKRCQKRLVTIQVSRFASSRDDAIQLANETGGPD